MRIGIACNLVRYHQMHGRDLMAVNMHWNQVMKNFEIQGKALKDQKEDDDPTIPKITKALPLIKWMEAFMDFLHHVIGVQTIPLAYVILPMADVPGVVPALVPNQPHSEEHGSVENELIAQASHAHPLFREDNSAMYYHLEEATQGTTYTALIKPFQQCRDGHDSWFTLMNQYAGRDKWEAEIKCKDNLLHAWLWKHQSNFLLEGFIAQHQNACVCAAMCYTHRVSAPQ